MSKTGGRGPTDLKGTLGTLIRTTINQVGAVSDVARRSALAQKQRLDGALLERKRRDALADLGELLYQLVQAGEIDIGEVPELADGVAEVEDFEQRIAEAEQVARSEPSAGRLGHTGRADWSRSPRTSEPAAGRVWRPNLDDIAEPAPAAEPEQAQPAPPPQPARPARSQARPRPAPASRNPQTEGVEPTSGGGIVFLDDDPEPDDLSEYMHEDDVPSRDR